MPKRSPTVCSIGQPDPISWQCADSEIAAFEYGYDPRLVCIDGVYYATWYHGYRSPSIS